MRAAARYAAAIAVLAAALLAGGCGPQKDALTDIYRFEELQSRFDADAAHPRLVLLLSPT